MQNFPVPERLKRCDFFLSQGQVGSDFLNPKFYKRGNEIREIRDVEI